MPEAYTHVRTARAALLTAAIQVDNMAAFEMGASGPDVFFAYNILSKHPKFDMATLGKRMHRQCCGEFLCNMVVLAKTPAQRAYTLGFLSHNATDALIHPYVSFITSAGQRYNRPQGHGFYEIALDSTLYKKDKGTRLVPVKDTAPMLKPLELAEICQLMHDTVLKVFNEDFDYEGFADSYHDFRMLHKFFMSRFGIKKVFAFFIETFILRKPGLALSHMTPAKLVKNLPPLWVNQFTNEKIEGTAFELLPPAEQISTAFFKSAQGFWAGRLSYLQLTRLIGDHSYETGLESESLSAPVN